MVKKYTSSDIKVLNDREHVRLRTALYMGSMEQTTLKIPLFNDKFEIKEVTFIPSYYKAIGEITDNSIDEFSQVYSKRHKLEITANCDEGRFEIKDNGRGIPIDIHESGKFTPEVVLASLRSGRNFEDNKEVGTIGQNGVGSAVVNYLSKEFTVTIHRDKKEYQQMFMNGCDIIGNPIVRRSSATTQGTTIKFQLDDEIFSDISIPEYVIRNRAKELALTNPSIEVTFNNESYKFKKGFSDIVPNISTNFHQFTLNDGNKTYEFFVMFDVNQNIDEEIFTWVNSSLLFEGGICNTQFMNAFVSKTISHLEREAKKQKSTVTKNDIRENLLVFGNIKISDPQYNSQSKLYLTGPSMRKEMDVMIDDSWNAFTKKNKEWLNNVLEKAVKRHHKSANDKAIKEYEKTSRKTVSGFKDATSRKRDECEVFITEGASAASEILSVRNPKLQASFALTGKVNNVFGVTPAQLLKMGKLTDLLTIIGVVPSKKANISSINFGRIIIATDADADGADIFSLLINIFYQFWPEMFNDTKPIFYRLLAPNVVAVNKSKRVHFRSLNEFKKVSSKYKGWEVSYYKGLGSMLKEDWKMVMSELDKYCIPIQDDGNMSTILTMLFDENSDVRKKWLT